MKIGTGCLVQKWFTDRKKHTHNIVENQYIPHYAQYLKIDYIIILYNIILNNLIGNLLNDLCTINMKMVLKSLKKKKIEAP